MFLDPLLQWLKNTCSENAATYITLLYPKLFTLKCTFYQLPGAKWHDLTEDLPRGFKPKILSLLMLEIFEPHREKPLSGRCENCHTDACPAQPSAWFSCRYKALSRDPFVQVWSRKQQHSRAAIPPAFRLLVFESLSNTKKIRTISSTINWDVATL